MTRKSASPSASTVPSADSTVPRVSMARCVRFVTVALMCSSSPTGIGRRKATLMRPVTPHTPSWKIAQPIVSSISAVTIPPCTVPSYPECSRPAVKVVTARSRATSKSRCSPCGFARPQAKHQWSKSIPSSESRAISVARSYVELRFLGVGHDPFLAPLDLVAHELLERQVGLLGVLERDTLEGARQRIERRVPQLLGVHLREALVPGDRRLAPALPVVGAFVGVGRRGVLVRLWCLGGGRGRGAPTPLRCRRGRRSRALGVGSGLHLAIVALLLRLGLQLLDGLVALVVGIRPAHFLPELQAIERRLADVDAAFLHERPEVAVEGGEEGRGGGRAGHGGVGGGEGVCLRGLSFF